MTVAFRTLLISTNAACRGLLARLIDGSDIVMDDVVGPEQVIASVARRAPDLVVIDAENDLPSLAQVCVILKANPATVLLPLVAIARSAKQRLAAFEAGVDDFLTHQVRREEFLVRARSLLRVSAARRQLAAEQLAQEVQRLEVIRAAFRRYISPKVADQILANPDVRDVAFMQTRTRIHAADMRGFTALSERINPDEPLPALILRGRSTPIDIFCLPSGQRVDFRPH